MNFSKQKIPSTFFFPPSSPYLSQYAMLKPIKTPAEKLLANAARLKRVAQNKFERKKQLERYNEVSIYHRQVGMQNSAIQQVYRDERRYRRDEWQMGSRLIPRRDVGTSRQNYAHVSSEMWSFPDVPEHLRQPMRISPGDKVVVMEGKERGKIGKVKDVDEERQTVSIEEMNKVNT